jgi:cobalt-zinc-cadmium efflux system outer membrane protein
VLEAAAVFQRELSIIAARSHDGAVAVYPLGENVHKNGVLKTTIAPAAVDPATQARAEAIAERERTTARLEGRRAELIQQLELSWKSVEIAQVRIRALSEGAMRDAEATLRVAQAAYRFGERGILDVLDAQRVLRAVRQELLLARYQLQASLIELDTLAGRYVSPNQ